MRVLSKYPHYEAIYKELRAIKSWKESQPSIRSRVIDPGTDADEILRALCVLDQADHVISEWRYTKINWRVHVLQDNGVDVKSNPAAWDIINGWASSSYKSERYQEVLPWLEEQERLLEERKMDDLYAPSDEEPWWNR